MLKIYSSQIHSFNVSAQRDFEAETVVYLANNFPKHAAILGTAILRDVVHRGVERASSHAMNFVGEVRVFIGIQLMLGCAFYKDPQYPWAAQILEDSTPATRHERADRLHERIVDFLDKVAGPQDTYFYRSLHEVSKLTMHDLPQIEVRGFDRTMVALMHRTYPQKAACVGDGCLSVLVEKALERAATHGIMTGFAPAIFVGCAFNLGLHFDDDPQYPWMVHILRDNQNTAPDRMAELLFGAVKRYTRLWHS